MAAQFYFSFSKNFLYVISIPSAPSGAVIIIAMTANAFSDDVERTLSAGMDEHLSKPVDANSISQTILKCLKRRFE